MFSVPIKILCFSRKKLFFHQTKQIFPILVFLHRKSQMAQCLRINPAIPVGYFLRYPTRQIPDQKAVLLKHLPAKIPD